MTEQQINALRAVAGIFVDTVKAAGPTGAPAGVMYAACLGKLSLDQFEQIMSALVATGKLVKRGQVYLAVDPDACPHTGHSRPTF
jgi:hypothetical protein